MGAGGRTTLKNDRGADAPWVEVPGAAAQHTLLTGTMLPGASVRRRVSLAVVVAILRPFTDVAMPVMEPPDVRRGALHPLILPT